MARVDSTLLKELQLSATHEGAIASGGVDWLHPETQDRYAAHVTRYREWISQGHAGPMHYLVRGIDRRADPTLVLPGIQSAFVALFPYDGGSRHPSSWEHGPEYARYMRGGDYHSDLKSRLTRIAEAAKSQAPHLEYKVCVDTSAVLERAWAELAGLGWIGRNTLLIHPQEGSFVFIGVIFINCVLGTGPQLLPNYCGNCTRCVCACPTQAFAPPHGGTLITERCISALTLETRGARSDTFGVDPTEKRAWIAGCDRCQEVCPFNQKRAKREGPSPTQPGQMMTWEDHWLETESEYKARIKDTALSRIRYADARRNLEISFSQLPREIRDPILVRVAQRRSRDVTESP